MSLYVCCVCPHSFLLCSLVCVCVCVCVCFAVLCHCRLSSFHMLRWALAWGTLSMLTVKGNNTGDIWDTLANMPDLHRYLRDPVTHTHTHFYSQLHSKIQHICEYGLFVNFWLVDLWCGFRRWKRGSISMWWISYKSSNFEGILLGPSVGIVCWLFGHHHLFFLNLFFKKYFYLARTH